tara:strand:- start:777 stop:1139 length:363 start_codon:yes stop_codon:yes gene_type:complete
MANPSATPASAAGTEILRRSFKIGLNATPYKIIDGVANHTYTLLSISFMETAGALERVYMKIATEASGNDVFLINQDLPANSTFIYNDKIMLWDTDELVVLMSGPADVDVYCTYIEQRWA